MRKTVLSLVSVAALALAGCQGSSSDQAANGGPANAESAAKVSIPSEVSGTISLRAGTPQPSDKATLVLNLVDVSSTAVGSAPLATKTSPAGSFPQPFKLTFNPADVKPNDLYVVQAILTDGERQYVMPIQAPVLAKGSNNDAVSIQLVAEQTPGEKLLAAFDDVQKQLGAMKVNHGTKLEKDASQAGEGRLARLAAVPPGRPDPVHPRAGRVHQGRLHQHRLCLQGRQAVGDRAAAHGQPRRQALLDRPCRLER